MMSVKRLCAVVSGLLLLMPGFGQNTPNFAPGVARWDLKTSLMTDGLAETPANLTFTALRGLKPPPADLLKHPDVRMRASGASGPQEGDIVSTDAWVQLVAVEASKKKGSSEVTDGDYHIQVSATRTNRDDVVIVEVPRPDFISDPALRQQVDALRTMLRTKLHSGTEFSLNTGSCIVHPVKMRLVGQLFYDETHSTANDPGGGRGKQGHHAATLWELHPLFAATILSTTGQPAVSCP